MDKNFKCKSCGKLHYSTTIGQNQNPTKCLDARAQYIDWVQLRITAAVL